MMPDFERPKPEFRLGIRGRIALWFILGAVTLLLMGGYAVYATGLTSIQGTLGQTYCQIAGRVSDQLQSRMLDRHNLVRGIATDVLTAAVVTEATDIYGSHDAQWAHLRRQRLEQEWRLGKLKDKAASLHRQLSNRLTILAGLEQTLPRGLRAYDAMGVLVGAMELPQKRSIWGDAIFKIVSSRKEHFTYFDFNRTAKSITIVLPVWSSTKIVGYVMGEFDFPSLMEGIGNIRFGDTGEALMLDYAGVPLMGPPKKYLIDAVKLGEGRASHKISDDGSYWVALNNTGDEGIWDRLACISPMANINALRETTELPPWSIIVSQSPNESYGALERSLKVSGLAGIMGVLFIGLAGGLAATRLTSPLRQLRDGVRQFAAGNRGFRVAFEGADEIGDLAKEFNFMADRVVISENELNAFAQAVESATDAIVLTNTESIIYYVNPAFEQITGFSAEEAEGKTPSILRSPSEERGLQKKIWTKVSTGEPWRGEIENRRKNGETYPADLSISPIFDGNGEVVSLLGIHRDITLAHEYQHKLEHEVEDRTREIASTQGLTAMGHMASMVAHDLRNALSTIKMNLQILSRQKDESRESTAHEEHFQIALGQVKYMEEFLADMLVYARPESINVEPCDAGDLVEGVVAAEAALATSQDIRINLTHNYALPAILCDLSKMTAVLHNLVENAIQAMPDGGDIAISMTLEKTKILNGYADQELLRINILDSGVGIPDDVLPDVFKPFFTTRTKGTGLGLAIAKRIIEQQGGTLSVIPGGMGGTLVSFTVPVMKTENQSSGNQ